MRFYFEQMFFYGDLMGFYGNYDQQTSGEYLPI